MNAVDTIDSPYMKLNCNVAAAIRIELLRR